MLEEKNLPEAFLPNRWGRDQKVKPGRIDKVRVAPFDALGIEGNGYLPDELDLKKEYAVIRIGQRPGDETITIYIDLGNGEEKGYNAMYFQAVDERKVKNGKPPFTDRRKFQKN